MGVRGRGRGRTNRSGHVREYLMADHARRCDPPSASRPSACRWRDPVRYPSMSRRRVQVSVFKRPPMTRSSILAQRPWTAREQPSKSTTCHHGGRICGAYRQPLDSRSGRVVLQILQLGCPRPQGRATAWTPLESVARTRDSSIAYPSALLQPPFRGFVPCSPRGHSHKPWSGLVGSRGSRCLAADSPRPRGAIRRPAHGSLHWFPDFLRRCLTFVYSFRLAFEAELLGGRTGAVRFTDASWQQMQGLLIREANFGRIQGAGILRFWAKVGHVHAFGTRRAGDQLSSIPVHLRRYDDRRTRRFILDL